MAVENGRGRMLDGLAIGAGALCLVHCLALPVLLLALPTLAAILIVPEAFHLYLLVFGVPTSLLALISGLRRHGGIPPIRAWERCWPR